MGSDKELRVGRDGKYQFYMEISMDNYLILYDRDERNALRYKTKVELISVPEGNPHYELTIESALERALRNLESDSAVPHEFDFEVDEIVQRTLFSNAVSSVRGHYPKRK